jgi:hypothetical protein
LLFLYYFNWAGTPEELTEFVGRMKTIIKGTDGIEFSGIFVPTSEWHYALLMKTANYEKSLQVMKTYIKKFGWAKTSLAKAELFHTFEELGLKD